MLAVPLNMEQPPRKPPNSTPRKTSVRDSPTINLIKTQSDNSVISKIYFKTGLSMAGPKLKNYTRLSTHEAVYDLSCQASDI